MILMRHYCFLLAALLAMSCGSGKQAPNVASPPPPPPPPVEQPSPPPPPPNIAPAPVPTAARRPAPSMPTFPWPPPQASSRLVLANSLLVSGQQNPNLGNIDDRITAALLSAGYSERAYFAVPDGFAIVTKLEQINNDGTSKQPPARWVATGDSGPSSFSLSSYIRALFTANAGYYRVIAFLVTDVPFAATGAAPTEDQTTSWLRNGFNALPADVRQQPYGAGFSCTALIYEFERTESSPPTLTSNGPDAETHLQKAGIWDKLKGGQ